MLCWTAGLASAEVTGDPAYKPAILYARAAYSLPLERKNAHFDQLIQQAIGSCRMLNLDFCDEMEIGAANTLGEFAISGIRNSENGGYASILDGQWQAAEGIAITPGEAASLFAAARTRYLRIFPTRGLTRQELLVKAREGNAWEQAQVARWQFAPMLLSAGRYAEGFQVCLDMLEGYRAKAKVEDAEKTQRGLILWMAAVDGELRKSARGLILPAKLAASLQQYVTNWRPNEPDSDMQTAREMAEHLLQSIAKSK